MIRKSLFKNVHRLFVVAALTMSMCLFCGCGQKEAAEAPAREEPAGEAAETVEEPVEETTEEAAEDENPLHAADPMTQEEMEAEDSDGCIEDSEDLLY